MSEYTDEEFRGLITCKKRVTQSPRREPKLEHRHFRNDFWAESTDGQYKFRIFLRQSAEFDEDFSIGLHYYPKDGESFCLIRCNGRHAKNRKIKHHSICHIHRALAEDINAGLRREILVSETTDYYSFREAQPFFFRLIGLEDVEKYFPGIFQNLLFPESTEIDASDRDPEKPIS